MGDEWTAPRLTVSVVAQRLGIAPATLRTWDRRYGVGPSEHVSGARRQYAPADLARLEGMRKLVLDGVAAGEAARAVLAPDGSAAPTRSRARQFPDSTGHVPRRAPAGRRSRHLPDAAGLVRCLVRAAHALDAPAVTAVVGELLREHGVLPAWDQVLVPALTTAGARWETTGAGVETEHLLSDCVADALRRHRPGQPPASSGRPVLLACAPDELHALPLHALAAALAECGHGCRLLGAAVPADALRSAVRRTGAAVLFVWSQQQSTGDPAPLAALPVTRPPTAVVAGGPGWHLALPARVTRVQDLGAALDVVGRALTGEALASSG